jgi:hypothetical protein
MPSRHRDAVAIALLLTIPRLARADAPTDDAREKADAEFAAGKKLLDDGQTAAACARFAKSQDLDPKLGRLLNLAFCHEQEGKIASSWNEYNAAAAMAAQKAQPDRVDFAREHATAVAKRLSFLHLDVPAGVDVVQVDDAGVPRDRWAMPMPLDPGPHKVQLTGANKKPATAAVQVSSEPGVQDLLLPPLADEHTETLSQVAAPSTIATPASDADGTSHASRLPAYVVGGVAIVGLGVGAIAGLQAMSKKSEADSQCPAKQCDPAGRAIISDAQTAATVSTVGFGVGIAGAVATVWLYVHESSARPQTARLTPVIGPASLGLEGTW